MSVRDLINAIIDSEADQIQSSFKEEMTSRIIDRLEEMKENIAPKLFKHTDSKAYNNNLDEELLSELSAGIRARAAKEAAKRSNAANSAVKENPTLLNKSKEAAAAKQRENIVRMNLNAAKRGTYKPKKYGILNRHTDELEREHSGALRDAERTRDEVSGHIDPTKKADKDAEKKGRTPRRSPASAPLDIDDYESFLKAKKATKEHNKEVDKAIETGRKANRDANK
jgi:hypothetical protein